MTAGRLFDLGDPFGDELIRTTDDGATVAEPTLWQDARPATSAEILADAVAADLLADGRRRMAEHETATAEQQTERDRA